MLYLYNKALEEKIKSLGLPTIYAPVSNFYKRYEEGIQNNKPLTFPAISFWPKPFKVLVYEAKERLRLPVEHISNQDDNTKETLLYTVPVNLGYSVDLWTITDTLNGTQGDVDRDDLMTEIIYYFQKYPLIEIKYKGMTKQFELLMEDVIDNSDISKSDSQNTIYRTTIDFRIDGSQLFYTNELSIIHKLMLQYKIDNDIIDEKEIKEGE